MIAAMVLGAGCSGATEPGGGVCTAVAVPGIVVAVRDSASGTVAGAGAVVTARAGAYADTARRDVPVEWGFPLAYERTGTYTVRVELAGYRPWVRSDVRVTADACHVRTVALTALLQR